ncbi:hypothetical protein RRF57_008370 [Xylaria bambusicola]|uniref:Uncharacterized protein n=1 Tax=Xylaria bambusicola TaxID=326684 RepID=A0AAN7UTT7_9PEZI
MRKRVEKNNAAHFKLYDTSRSPGSNEASKTPDSELFRRPSRPRGALDKCLVLAGPPVIGCAAAPNENSSEGYPLPPRAIADPSI